MTTIRLLPWEPAGDARFHGVRLLLLGESHYEEEKWRDHMDLSPDYTRDIVADCGAKPESRQPFFANTYELLTGRPWTLHASDHAELWNSVFFYNYVQRLVPGGARVRPSREMWQGAAEPFKAALERVRPEAVLVLGERLWQNMLDGECLREESDALGKVYGFQLADRAMIPAAHVFHPSSGRLRPRVTHARVMRFLEGVRRSEPAAAGPR